MRTAQTMALPYFGRAYPDHTLLYDFKKLPETEALADALNYVCETNNASAGGSETGVGGGQTGADLVLIQGGTLPGAVAGWRTVTDRAAMYLQPTDTFLNAFIRNTIGFSAMLKLRNINTTGATSTGPMLMYLSEDTGKLTMNYQRAPGYYAARGALSADGAVGIGILPNANHADFNAGLNVPLYLLVSVDYVSGLVFSGFSKNKQPSSLADCSVYNISQPKAAISVPPAMTFSSYRFLIGCAASYIANGCDIASITFAKYPSVTLK